MVRVEGFPCKAKTACLCPMSRYGGYSSENEKMGRDIIQGIITGGGISSVIFQGLENVLII